MNADPTKDFLLGIQRDAFSILTMDLHGMDTRAMVMELLAAQPEAMRAPYIANLIRELTTGMGSALVLLHGSQQAAIQATQAMALKFETIAPHLEATTCPPSEGDDA